MAEEKREKNEDFQYIVRIANRDLDGERTVQLALADLKGIGNRLSEMIIKKLDLPKSKKIGELSEKDLDKLREYIDTKQYDGIPVWAYNHRDEMVTGEDLNLVTNDHDLQINDDINAMKKVKSYKGVRHEKGKKVRGQRTRSNGRRGLTVGVQRKKD